MTAFTTADIPASVDSLEKLVAWAGLCLNRLYPDLTATEGTDSTNTTTARVAQSSVYYMTPAVAGSTIPPTWRIISRSSLKVNAAWTGGATKLWANVESLGTAAIPAEFKS